MYFGGNPQKISRHILVQLMNEWDSLIDIHHVQDRHERKDKIDVWILRNRIWPRMRGGMHGDGSSSGKAWQSCLPKIYRALMYDMTIR